MNPEIADDSTTEVDEDDLLLPGDEENNYVTDDKTSGDILIEAQNVNSISKKRKCFGYLSICTLSLFLIWSAVTLYLFFKGKVHFQFGVNQKTLPPPPSYKEPYDISYEQPFDDDTYQAYDGQYNKQPIVPEPAQKNDINNNHYHEIVSDLDFYTLDGNERIPNCVQPGTYTNKDLSANIIQSPIENCESLPPSGIPDVPVDANVGDAGQEGEAAFGVPNCYGSSYRYSRRLMDANQSVQWKKMIDDKVRGDTYLYRMQIGSDLEADGLGVHRNVVILNSDDKKNRLIYEEQQISIPSTKFNEHYVSAPYLFNNSYLFDIPYASLNILLGGSDGGKNINDEILDKLSSKNDLTNKVLEDNNNTYNDFDPYKYSPFCDDLSFFELNSDFLYNTKVYLPDPNKNIHSNCHGYIAKSIYDAQEYINKIQNTHGDDNELDTKESCGKEETRDILYYPPGNPHGIGAQVQGRAYQLAHSVLNGYKMVSPYIHWFHAQESFDEFSEFCGDKYTVYINETAGDSYLVQGEAEDFEGQQKRPGDIHYNCLLKPMTICDNYAPHKYNYVNNRTLDRHFEYAPLLPSPPDGLFKYDLGEIFWNAQMLKYITKPSNKLLDIINSYKKKLNFNKYRDEGIIGVHVRHGDTCSKTMFRWMRKCNTFDEYMVYIDKINKLYGYKNIYIATDDGQIIEDIKNNKYPKYNFLYTDFDRDIYSGDQWIEYREEINYKQIYMEALIEIAMLSESSALVGTFSSNLSRVVYLLMMANSGGYKPFASLDTPWCMRNKGGYPC